MLRETTDALSSEFTGKYYTWGWYLLSLLTQQPFCPHKTYDNNIATAFSLNKLLFNGFNELYLYPYQVSIIGQNNLQKQFQDNISCYYILGSLADLDKVTDRKFMHWWRWLPCKVETSTSGAVWGSLTCPRRLRHADQGNQTSDLPITRRWLYIWATAAHFYH